MHWWSKEEFPSGSVKLCGIWQGAYFFKDVRWEKFHWWWAHVPGSYHRLFQPQIYRCTRELQKVTLMDMPHYSRFLFPQRKEGSKAQGTVGRLKACLSYSLTQTPLNANSSGMQTDNVSPHKGVAEFSKIFETFSFFALPNPGNTVSLLDSLKCKLSTSLAPPASFFQPPR